VTGLLLLAVAAALLLAGAEVFVDNAASAARRLGVTVLAVGLLLAGAEPEELLTAALSSAAHHPGLAAGDAIGANVTMLTATLGLAAIVRPIPFGRRVRTYAVGSAAAGGLAVLVLLGGSIGRLGGAVLVAAYAALVAAVWWREREPPRIGELAEADEETSEIRSPAIGLALAVLGIGLMLLGGRIAVTGAERVLKSFHVAESSVGLTLLALVTTAELFALVWAAARRGAGEVAVAGVVGSAAYNATATLGVAALVRPLDTTGILPSAVLAAVAPVALVALGARGRLTRPAGALLLAVYAGFVVVTLR
jgi:cation:H+ antiporter